MESDLSHVMRLNTHSEWTSTAPRFDDATVSPLLHALAVVSAALFAAGLLLPATEGVPGYMMLRFGVYHYASNGLLITAPLLAWYLRDAAPWAVGLTQLVMTVSTMWVAFGALMFVAPGDLGSGYLFWVAAHAVMTLYVFAVTGEAQDLRALKS